MTRQGFLVITPVACALGVAITVWQGASFSFWVAGVATCAAVLMHAAANVLNDYHDAQSGADEANTQGLFPFTGGARLIQNGEVTPTQTRTVAYGLALAAMPLAGWLVWTLGDVALFIGLVGAGLGWAYSAPPLRLMTRGAGEFTVAMVWTLIVVGSDAAGRGHVALTSLAVALGYGLWIANILLINAYPDAPADASVGKRTAVVRLGTRRSAVLYAWLGLASAGCLGLALAEGHLPVEAAWGFISVPTGIWACMGLWRYAEQPAKLKPVIVSTILTAVLYGTGAALGSVWSVIERGASTV